MAEVRYRTIDRDQLAQKLVHMAPDNENRREGFALVNVLASEEFDRARIPGSANVPRGQEATFERRFDKNKEIIVYGGSPQGDASAKVARELAERGFRAVFEYEGGIRDWKKAGLPVFGVGGREVGLRAPVQARAGAPRRIGGRPNRKTG
jgi:rhodanese-related sulfurtransferase